MKSSTVMMNDSHKKSKVNEPDMSMHKHPIRDESYSGESDSCCSEEFNKFFHSNSRTKYLQSIKRDAEKHQWLELNDFIIIEIYEKDLPKLSISYIKKLYGISIV